MRSLSAVLMGGAAISQHLLERALNAGLKVHHLARQRNVGRLRGPTAAVPGMTVPPVVQDGRTRLAGQR